MTHAMKNSESVEMEVYKPPLPFTFSITISKSPDFELLFPRVKIKASNFQHLSSISQPAIQSNAYTELAHSQTSKAITSSKMENSFTNRSHGLVPEQHEFQSDQSESDWEDFDLTWSPYVDLGDEEPEEEDDFYADGDSCADVDLWGDADGSYSDDDEWMQDCVEYVHFGRGMEFDGGQWIWEEDVDLWRDE